MISNFENGAKFIGRPDGPIKNFCQIFVTFFKFLSDTESSGLLREIFDYRKYKMC